MTSGDLPVPQGNYIAAKRFNDIIFTAGMTPRKNGVLILSGQIKADEPLSSYKEAVTLAVSNGLAAARSLMTPNESKLQVLSMTVYLSTREGFTAHSKLADYASEYLYEQLGSEGIGSRAAVGVNSLPGDAPIEIQMVFGVE